MGQPEPFAWPDHELVGVTAERYAQLVRENAYPPTVPCQPPGAKRPCHRCVYYGQSTPTTIDPVAALLGGPAETESFLLPAECRFSVDRKRLPRSKRKYDAQD